MEAQIAMLKDLRRTNERWNVATEIVEDYNVALQRCLDLEVRIGQLQKENQEIREENSSQKTAMEKLSYDLSEVKSRLSAVFDERDSKREILEKELQVSKSSSAGLDMQLQEANDEINSTKAEKTALSEELDKTKEAVSVTVTEMHGHREEKDQAQEKLRILEAENRTHVNTIIELKQHSIEKLQEIQEMEDMVQRKKEEVDRMSLQLKLEKEISVASNTLSASFKFRKQNPYAKRLCGIASILDKGESSKALQALDAILVELRALSGASVLPSAISVNEEGVVFVNDADTDNEQSSKKDTLKLPKFANLAHLGHQGGCSSSSACYSGSLLATAGVDKKVLVWDPINVTIQTSLTGAPETIMDVSFTSKENVVLGACADKAVHVWNTSSKKCVHVMTGHTRGVNCIACDPTDTTKAISSGEDRYIRFWNLTSGYQISNRAIDLQESTNAVCYAYSGCIAAGMAKGSLKVWDMHSTELLSEYPCLHDGMIVALYPFPFTSHLMLSAGRDNKLKLFDFRNRQVVEQFSCGKYALGTMGYQGKGKCCLGVSKNEQFFTAGSNSGDVLVWKANEHKPCEAPEVMKTNHHQEAVVATAWCDQRMFSCDKAGNVVAWTQ